MSAEKITSILYEANKFYNQAEKEENEGSSGKAKDFYTQAQSLYNQISEMYMQDDLKDTTSSENMRLIADTCGRKVQIMGLKAELLRPQIK